MSIFSRRKRLLNRTPRPPKMSSRRQFHRALRRHPAWPAVMEQAAQRARAQESVQRDHTNSMTTGQASTRKRFRQVLRRNRAGVIALVSVGALVALLSGIGAATHGKWFPVIDLAKPTGAGGPASRYGAASTFDMTRGEMLIFGGSTSPNGISHDSRNLGDTWGLLGGRWFNRNPVHHPSPRGYASMAYDGARKNVVLFGGSQASGSIASGGEGSLRVLPDETWTWDGADWTLLNPPVKPPARTRASMAYDAHRKIVVLFGGTGANNASLGDTWIWDGSTWTEKKFALGKSPSPRDSAAMTHDICRGKTVLFGGLGTDLPSFGGSQPGPLSNAGQTWTWDGAEWKNETPPLPGLSPPPRVGAGMAYSYQSGRVLLYGGLDVSTGLRGPAIEENVWMWDGVTWEREIYQELLSGLPGLTGEPTPWPPPRAYASVVSDPGHGGLYVIGGTPHPTTAVALPDGWGFHETEFGTGSIPAPRRCNNPVPIPGDDASAGEVVSEGPQLRKVETREEIREIGRLPALVGDKPAPYGSPQPDCPHGSDLESVAHTHLATDPKRNRVYQFFICTPPQQGETKKILIQAYDAKTLKPLKSVLALVTYSFTNLPNFKENPPLHDPDRGRFLYRLGQDLWVIQQDLIEKGVNPANQKITLPITGISNVEVFSHPKTGRAKLLISIDSPLKVVQFDLDDNREDWNRTLDGCESAGFGGRRGMMRAEDRVYTYCVTSGFRYGVVRIPIGQDLNDPAKEAPGTPELFPGPVFVTASWGDPKAERLLLLSDTENGQTVYVFDGKASRYVGRSPLTVKSGINGYGFDRETGRLYANVPDTRANGGAGAPALGGLRVLDTRLTPVTQAANFGRFSWLGEAAIGILPSEPGYPRRVFMRRATGNVPGDPDDPNQRKRSSDSVYNYADGEIHQLEDEMHYLVLADSLPVPEQPELSQLDALTIPVAESPGKTDVSFDSEGSGYGIRLRSVGGISSALRLPPQNNLSVASDTAEQGIFSNKLSPPCLYPDRELMAGWVFQARLSDLETSARSLGLEVDSASKSDLEGPSTRCVPPIVSPATFPSGAKAVADLLWPLLPFAQTDSLAGPNLRWGKQFKETECVGDSSQANEAKLGDTTVSPSALVRSGVTVPSGVPTGTVTAPTGGIVPIGGITSSATCNQKGAYVQGISRGALGGSATSDAFSVGEGYSNVTVARDPEKGIVVISTAVATGIKLPGITIGHVTATAVAWSNGRPGEGRATFTREICNVKPPLPVNPANSDPRPANSDPSAPNTGCLNDAQQAKMAKDFNARMGINGKMTLPVPDPAYFKGSPGGYIAGVTKPLADETEDQLFARDFQKEIPALQIVFYKDSTYFGDARQVLELAAVRAVAGYGVQCNSELTYSPSAKNCLALAFEDDSLEFEEEEEFASSDDTEPEFDGAWTQIETGAPGPLSLGGRIGRYIANLPVIRLLPIRQIGEALLAGSVWLLLGLPLLFAGRRLTINLGRNN